MTSEEFSKHKYGPGVVKELATKYMEIQLLHIEKQ